MPDEWAQPSYKMSVRGYIGMATGTNNYGFVGFSPTSFANDSTTSAAPLIFTISNYAGQDFDPQTSTPGVISANLTRNPYTSAQYASTTGPRTRIVAAGIRIRYTGALIDRGGTVTVFRHPDNANMPTQSWTSLVGMSNSVSIGVTDKWTTLNWIPSKPADQAYGTPDHKVCMGFFIQSAKPGATFSVQTIVHYEHIGSTVLTTPSHSDAQGMSAIRNSLPQFIEPIAEKYEKTVMQNINNYLLAGSTVAVSYAASALYGTYLGSLQQRPQIEYNL